MLACSTEKQDTIVEENDPFEKYHSICEYDGQSSGQISFPEGAEMIIIDKDDDGKMVIHNYIAIANCNG